MWLEWYEHRQLAPAMYEPIGGLEFDLLLLAIVEPHVTPADL